MLSGFSRTVIRRTCLKLRDVSPEPITHEIIEIVQQSRTPHINMWIVRLVGSIATLEIEGSWFRIGPRALHQRKGCKSVLILQK